MGRVIWSDQALDDLERIGLDDLERIGKYIAEFNPAAAARLLIRLRAAGERLEAYPERGRPTFAQTRELTTVRPYIIRYWVEDDDVVIVRIRHGAQRPDR